MSDEKRRHGRLCFLFARPMSVNKPNTEVSIQVNNRGRSNTLKLRGHQTGRKPANFFTSVHICSHQLFRWNWFFSWNLNQLHNIKVFLKQRHHLSDSSTAARSPSEKQSNKSQEEMSKRRRRKGEEGRRRQEEGEREAVCSDSRSHQNPQMFLYDVINNDEMTTDDITAALSSTSDRHIWHVRHLPPHVHSTSHTLWPCVIFFAGNRSAKLRAGNMLPIRTTWNMWSSRVWRVCLRGYFSVELKAELNVLHVSVSSSTRLFFRDKHAMNCMTTARGEIFSFLKSYWIICSPSTHDPDEKSLTSWFYFKNSLILIDSNKQLQM